MISKMIQRGYVTTNLKNDQCQWPMSRWWFYLKKKKKLSEDAFINTVNIQENETGT